MTLQNSCDIVDLYHNYNGKICNIVDFKNQLQSHPYLKVIGQMKVVLTIEDIKMPVKLLVIDSDQKIILLGIN